MMLRVPNLPSENSLWRVPYPFLSGLHIVLMMSSSEIFCQPAEAP